jgi:3-isopropylmalate dehydratase small subunit
MAKAILEFDLSEPDDRMAFKRANKALDMTLVLFEIQNNFRKKCMRELEAKEEFGLKLDAYWGADLVLERLHALLQEYNIDTDEIIN